ncbi:MAG: hypothetical protein Q4G28_01445 [Neisseria sp.]|nr:hypothetical protein [Neisseria sp.]
MLPDSALKEMFPVVMTPSHDGKYFHNYTLSLLNLLASSFHVGLNMQVSLQRGESLITRARNNAVADFLANPQWTHLFWIDSDIGFSPQAAYRLLLSDYDVACGVYPLKYENWPSEGVPAHMTQAQFEAHFTRYTINHNQQNTQGEVVVEIGEDGFFEVDEAPTGFMVIKRSVFERLMAAYPGLQYLPDSIGVGDRGLHYRFFDVMVDPESRRYLSEDYGFCKLWRDIGGKIHADGQSNLSHQGAKLYRGSFADSLAYSLQNAVGAPDGRILKISGMQHLQPNERGPE